MLLSSKTTHPAPKLTVLKTFRRKESLPLYSDHVWCIEQGVVRTVTWNDQGQLITLGLWGRGDIVGQPLTQIDPYQIECLTPVVAINAPLGSYSPYWRDALLSQLWQSEELLRIIHQVSVSDRLMQLLDWLAQRFGKPVPQGRLLAPILTHQQLSEVLGTSRVTITRLLTRLEKEGRLMKFTKTLGRWTNDADWSYPKGTILVVAQPSSQLVEKAAQAPGNC